MITDAPIEVLPYDPYWPRRFEQEKERLQRAVGPWVTGGIHHVGSTAVPGLDAKPIVDILVGVESLDASRACFDRLLELDYQYAAYRPAEMHWFCKPNASHGPIIYTLSQRARSAIGTSWHSATRCALSRPPRASTRR